MGLFEIKPPRRDLNAEYLTSVVHAVHRFQSGAMDLEVDTKDGRKWMLARCGSLPQAFRRGDTVELTLSHHRITAVRIVETAPTRA